MCSNPPPRRALAFSAAVFGGLAALCAAAPVPAQPPTAADPVYGYGLRGVWTLTAEEERVHLTDVDGIRHDLGAVEKPQLSSLALLAEGWVAAGSFEAAGGERRLVLWQGEEGVVRRLIPPAAGRAPIQRRPVLLVDGGRLAGLAWLEGQTERSLTVRAAAWDGTRFRRPERVSGIGPGSQLALSGAVLGDGRWLLLWSRFDGQDDEVVWSQRVGTTWSPVARLADDNRLPDVVPAVTALDGGALAAWSRYDGGQYRVVTARFAGGAWGPPRPVGPPGSLYPVFVPGSGGARLLFAEARVPGWTLVELDGTGTELYRGTAVGSLAVRPAVVEGQSGLAVRWPGGGEPVALRTAPARREVP